MPFYTTISSIHQAEEFIVWEDKLCTKSNLTSPMYHGTNRRNLGKFKLLELLRPGKFSCLMLWYMLLMSLWASLSSNLWEHGHQRLQMQHFSQSLDRWICKLCETVWSNGYIGSINVLPVLFPLHLCKSRTWKINLVWKS